MNTKKALSTGIILLTFSIACDKQLSRELVSTSQHQETIECDGPAGLCGKWDYTPKGKYKYWLGLHASCPGHQNVLKTDELWRTTFQKKDGTTYKEDSTNSSVVKALSNCQ